MSNSKTESRIQRIREINTAKYITNTKWKWAGHIA